MAGAIRRAVVKQQPVKRIKRVVVAVYHAHACTSCGERYADRCDTPGENGQCMQCTHGHDVTVEQLDRRPKDCCKTHSQLMLNNDEVARYNLGGDLPWYQCVGPHGCFRTHPYDPTKPKKETP